MEKPDATIDVTSARLPTGGEWVDLPGTPFQVTTYAHEELGTVHLRIHPSLKWGEWENFQARLDEEYAQFLAQHPLAKALRWKS